MSRRHYPTAELYEERQRDFYRNGNRSERSYDELDLDLSHGNPRRSAPDFFLRDDHRSSAGQMVVHERREESIGRPAPRRREVEEDTLVIRGGRAPPPPPSSVREIERDDITIRRTGTEPQPRRPREVEREETDITIRHRDVSRPREDIQFRRGEGARGPPPRPREVDFEREEIKFQERIPTRNREVEREEFSYRRDDSRHGRENDTTHVSIRGRERSLPPPRSSRGELVAREHEEFVVRRREPSPPPREHMKEEIIIRRMEQERSPSPPPPPPPPPEPEAIVKPPIIQEIITHHRHIDHGVERARSPTPPPPPPSPPREDRLEIEIRRRESRGPGRGGFEEEFIFERDTRETSKPKSKDMWTEITKDLVLKEAIDAAGYDYEETDYFFYVMEYLKYEDVLQLVEISDDIRRKRKSRIRQIEYEREEIRDKKPGFEDRYYDHEVSYDRHRHRYR